MAKNNRVPKIKTFKTKTRKVRVSSDKTHGKLDEHDIEEGKVAKELLDKRNTAEFSRNELGALMQIAPGGAEPHQIKTGSRQFNRQISNAKPLKSVVEGRTGGRTGDLDGRGGIRRPKSGGPVLSQKNYKIDPED